MWYECESFWCALQMRWHKSIHQEIIHTVQNKFNPSIALHQSYSLRELDRPSIFIQRPRKKLPSLSRKKSWEGTQIFPGLGRSAVGAIIYIQQQKWTHTSPQAPPSTPFLPPFPTPLGALRGQLVASMTSGPYLPTQTHTNLNTNAHARTHACTNALASTHTRTRTHTHTG